MNDFREYSAAFNRRNSLSHALSSKTAYENRVRKVFGGLNRVYDALSDTDAKKVDFVLKKVGIDNPHVDSRIIQELDDIAFSDSDLTILENILSKYQMGPNRPAGPQPSAEYRAEQKRKKFLASRERFSNYRKSSRSR